jgi:hypothetical protein
MAKTERKKMKGRLEAPNEREITSFAGPGLTRRGTPHPGTSNSEIQYNRNIGPVCLLSRMAKEMQCMVRNGVFGVHFPGSYISGKNHVNTLSSRERMSHTHPLHVYIPS